MTSGCCMAHLGPWISTKVTTVGSVGPKPRRRRFWKFGFRWQRPTISGSLSINALIYIASLIYIAFITVSPYFYTLSTSYPNIRCLRPPCLLTKSLPLLVQIPMFVGDIVCRFVGKAPFAGQYLPESNIASSCFIKLSRQDRSIKTLDKLENINFLTPYSSIHFLQVGSKKKHRCNRRGHLQGRPQAGGLAMSMILSR